MKYIYPWCGRSVFEMDQRYSKIVFVLKVPPWNLLIKERMYHIEFSDRHWFFFFFFFFRNKLKYYWGFFLLLPFFLPPPSSKISNPSWSLTCYVTKDDLELLMVLLPIAGYGFEDHSCVALYTVIYLAREVATGFIQAKQALYQLNHIPSHKIWFLFCQSGQLVSFTLNLWLILLFVWQFTGFQFWGVMAMPDKNRKLTIL